MNVADIKRVVQEQERDREKLLTTEKIIKREGGKGKTLDALKFPNILAILGVRRCGKSVFSWLVLEGKKYGHINFDDEALYGIKAQDLNLVLKTFYELYGTDLEFIVLDEIQNVIGWELFANRLRRTKKVIITGSNSRLLSGELTTHLTGRYIDFTLFPFSFREFLIYRDVSLETLKAYEYSTDTSVIAEKMLKEYIANGGFPEAHKFGMSILKPIFRDIVTKDVVRRYKIKNINAVEVLAKHLVSNFSNEMTYNKLKDAIEVKKINTIKNYVNYLQDAYLAFILERFSFKLKQQTIAPKKIYCIDSGIINTISFRTSENYGKLMENLVMVELLRRKSYWFDSLEVFYWKDHQQNEVDFVLKEGLNVKQLIQVTYASSKDEVEKREMKALVKASSELNCKDLLIITWDCEDEIKVRGKTVKLRPLWKWLLFELPNRQ
jgi:predicted AAA+ superfamily ATPase